MPTWPISSIKSLLEPTLNHMGYELYSLDQSGQSGRTLRISIDHSEPISIEDCERVSRVVGPLLDHANLIEGRYDLEVSSPGAERPLRSHLDYERFNGKRVHRRCPRREPPVAAQRPRRPSARAARRLSRPTLPLAHWTCGVGSWGQTARGWSRSCRQRAASAWPRRPPNKRFCATHTTSSETKCY